MDRVKKDPYSCLLICRVFSNSNLAIAPVAVSRFLENICQNPTCGVEGGGKLSLNKTGKFFHGFFLSRELIYYVPASTVYPGKGRCVTWEGGQERLQHFVWFTFTASHVCL